MSDTRFGPPIAGTRSTGLGMLEAIALRVEGVGFRVQGLDMLAYVSWPVKSPLRRRRTRIDLASVPKRLWPSVGRKALIAVV